MSWFRVKRGWQDSRFFNKEPYSEREAWLWMIGEAQWKDGTINVLGKPVFLKRGQFSSSIRFMAGKFGWSKDRVSRFLKRAEIWDMIASESATGQKVITICNYEKYQSVDVVDEDTTEDAVKDRVEDTPKDKLEEGKERKKVKNKESADAPKPENVSLEVWNDFKAQRKTKLTRTALAGIEREAQKAGFALEQALATAVMRGWQSFKSDWVKEGKNGRDERKSKSELADEAHEQFLREIYGQNGRGAGHGLNGHPPELRSVQHLREGPEGPDEHHEGIRPGLITLPH